jgi:biopolymer transport protein ExbD
MHPGARTRPVAVSLEIFDVPELAAATAVAPGMPQPLPSPLSASQRSRIRRLARPDDPQQGDEAGELNIVPYLDIITNIMMFVLASVAVAFVGTISVQPAFAGPQKIDQAVSPLKLTALVTSDGVALLTKDGHVAPGCSGFGAGVTVPKLGGGEHDLTALGACARRLKGARAEYAIESQVTLTASPDVPYQAVIAVMDALRSDDAGELFPAVHFGVAR